MLRRSYISCPIVKSLFQHFVERREKAVYTHVSVRQIVNIADAFSVIFRILRVHFEKLGFFKNMFSNKVSLRSHAILAVRVILRRFEEEAVNSLHHIRFAETVICAFLPIENIRLGNVRVLLHQLLFNSIVNLIYGHVLIERDFISDFLADLGALSGFCHRIFNLFLLERLFPSVMLRYCHFLLQNLIHASCSISNYYVTLGILKQVHIATRAPSVPILHVLIPQHIPAPHALDFHNVKSSASWLNFPRKFFVREIELPRTDRYLPYFTKSLL